MSIFVDKNTHVLVQGITGREGSFHTKQMLKDGTKIVAGTSPKKGGQKVADIPVFSTIREALLEIDEAQKPSWSISFVPAPHAAVAALEALEAGLNTVIISEHVPVLDTLKIYQASLKLGLKAIGPNCPGIIVPEQTKIGIMPADVFTPGHVGVVSRSGTLTYEIVAQLSKVKIGQSTCVGIGGDPINLTNLEQALRAFQDDEQTQAIVLIGEIGGLAEEKAAQNMIGKIITKPIVAYLAGKTAPVGKTMGHAGAIVEKNSGTFASKQAALKKAGVALAQVPHDVVKLVKRMLS